VAAGRRGGRARTASTRTRSPGRRTSSPGTRGRSGSRSPRAGLPGFRASTPFSTREATPNPARTSSRSNRKSLATGSSLFAPTFRGRGIDDAYYDYSRIDFARLYEMCGETSVVLFRMHHFVTVPVPIPPEYADRLVNYESFPETNDLLHVADVLITDYSS